MPPEVSIIIINYNTLSLTRQCILSVLEKTKDCRYEIILVDNASQEEGIDQLQFLSNNVKLIKSSRNLGFAGGNNLGINHASGEFILLLNSDTELKNNAIKIGKEVINDDKKIGVLSGSLLNPDGTIQAQAGKFPSALRELSELIRLNKILSSRQKSKLYLGTLANYKKIVDADWVWGAFFMFRKTDLELFPDGKLHAAFFMYVEDMQWCHYFKKTLKKRIIVHPEPKIVHHIGGSDKSKAKGFDRYKEKVLPNEYDWMVLTKGRLYTSLFYLIKGLHYYTLTRNLENKKKAKTFLKTAIIGY